MNIDYILGGVHYNISEARKARYLDTKVEHIEKALDVYLDYASNPAYENSNKTIIKENAEYLINAIDKETLHLNDEDYQELKNKLRVKLNKFHHFALTYASNVNETELFNKKVKQVNGFTKDDEKVVKQVTGFTKDEEADEKVVKQVYGISQSEINQETLSNDIEEINVEKPSIDEDYIDLKEINEDGKTKSVSDKDTPVNGPIGMTEPDEKTKEHLRDLKEIYEKGVDAWIRDNNILGDSSNQEDEVINKEEAKNLPATQEIIVNNIESGLNIHSYDNEIFKTIDNIFKAYGIKTLSSEASKMRRNLALAMQNGDFRAKKDSMLKILDTLMLKNDDENTLNNLSDLREKVNRANNDSRLMYNFRTALKYHEQLKNIYKEKKVDLNSPEYEDLKRKIEEKEEVKKEPSNKVVDNKTENTGEEAKEEEKKSETITKTKDGNEIVLKGLLAAAGFGMGFLISQTPGVGTIRMGLAAAKLASNVAVYTAKKHPESKAARAILSANEKVSSMSKKIPGIGKYADKFTHANIFVNGLSAGYLAGNIWELVNSAGELANVAYAEAPVIPMLNPGDTVDLSSLNTGLVSSNGVNPVNLATEYGKNAMFDKSVTLDDGTEMWHFLSQDGDGYAWFKADDVRNLMETSTKGKTL